MLARVKAAVEDIARANPGKTLALFSHGYAIRLLLANLQGISLRDTGEKSPVNPPRLRGQVKKARGLFVQKALQGQGSGGDGPVLPRLRPGGGQALCGLRAFQRAEPQPRLQGEGPLGAAGLLPRQVFRIL